MKKLNEKIVLSSFTTTYGIFTNISTNHSADFTWLSSNVAHTLDIDYYLNHSGEKFISPFYENLEKLVEAQESGNVLSLLGDSITLRFKDSWNKLYSALSDNYDPVEDMNMTETRTPNITKTRTDLLNETSKQNSDYTTATDSTQKGDVYGYNSTTAVPSQTIDLDSSVRVTGSKDSNYTSRDNTGTQTIAETGTDTVVKHGYGKKTAQELISEEIELRKKQFYEMIMNDVDTIMTCNVYD